MVSKKDKTTNDVAEKGHNRTGGIAAKQLITIIERVEKLEEEKAGIGSDIKDIYIEAKGNGYDVKTIRKCVALRKKDAAEREEEEYLLDTYKRAVGLTLDALD